MRPPQGLAVVGAKGAWPSIRIAQITKPFRESGLALPTLILILTRTRSLRLGRGHRGGDLPDDHVPARGGAMEREARGGDSAMERVARGGSSALEREARGGCSALEREAHSSDSCLTRQIRGSACELLERRGGANVHARSGSALKARGRGGAVIIVVRGWGDCLAFLA
jgi:hypothetical protein